jgi:hypothetical protein
MAKIRQNADEEYSPVREIITLETGQIYVETNWKRIG